MTYSEMLEILRGKVIHETKEEIQQRLNEIADTMEQLIRERDAAIKDCSLFDECFTCKHANVFSDTEPCKSCVHLEGGTSPNWEWRGVQDE